MSKIAIYIILSLIYAISVSAIICLFWLCLKWHKAYKRLLEKYNSTKKENIKLQHEVYKLHYNTPNVDTKRKENKNGNK